MHVGKLLVGVAKVYRRQERERRKRRKAGRVRWRGGGVKVRRPCGEGNARPEGRKMNANGM